MGFWVGFLLLPLGVFAQMPGLWVRVVPVWGDEVVGLGKQYGMKAGDSLEIETLRFYVSDLHCLDGRGAMTSKPMHPVLVDLEVPGSGEIELGGYAGKGCDSVALVMGIDSATNVSGALGGDLDPTKGMYWAWQSGYVNFKLEGTSPRCPARNHRFQFHLGGYRPPFAAAVTVRMAVKPEDTEVMLFLDLRSWFAGVDLSQQYEVMEPSKVAVALTQSLSRCFRTW